MLICEFGLRKEAEVQNTTDLIKCTEWEFDMTDMMGKLFFNSFIDLFVMNEILQNSKFHIEWNQPSSSFL